MATLAVGNARPGVGPEPRLRRISILWAAGAVLAVLYGSLLPFSVDPSLLTRDTGFGLLRIGLHRVGLEDLITNIVVYLPLGGAVALAVGTRRGWAYRLTVATAVGAAVSVVAESLQSAIPIRVACWSDVGLNTCGAMLGAVFAPAIMRIARGIVTGRTFTGGVDRPMRALAAFFTVALFLYQLAPFDFITTNAELHTSFRHAKWSLVTPRTTDPAAPFALLYGKAVGAAWFVALGYLMAKSRREAGGTSLGSVMTAIREGAVLVVVIELLQLFVRSHVFDAADIPLRIAALVMGAWGAAFLSSAAADSKRAGPGTSSHMVGTAVLAVWIVGQSMALLVEPLFRHGVVGRGGLGMVWPFEQLWRTPMLHAGWAIASTMIVYGVLTAMLLALLRRGRVAFAGLLTAVMVPILALDAALLVSPSGVRGVDPTSAILATVAVLLVLSLARYERSALHANQPTARTPQARVAD